MPGLAILRIYERTCKTKADNHHHKGAKVPTASARQPGTLSRSYILVQVLVHVWSPAACHGSCTCCKLGEPVHSVCATGFCNRFSCARMHSCNLNGCPTHKVPCLTCLCTSAACRTSLIMSASSRCFSLISALLSRHRLSSL
jgi:hypothetical protein